QREVIAVPLMSRGIPRVQGDRESELPLRPSPLPVVIHRHVGESGARLRKSWVELERPAPGAASLGKGLGRWQGRVEAKNRIRVRYTRVGRRVGGIPRQRLLEEIEALPESSLGAAIPVVAALEIQGVGLEIVGGRLDQGPPLSAQESYL